MTSKELKDVIREAMNSGDFDAFDINDLVEEVDNELFMNEELQEARESLVDAILYYLEKLTNTEFSEGAYEQHFNNGIKNLLENEESFKKKPNSKTDNTSQFTDKRFAELVKNLIKK